MSSKRILGAFSVAFLSAGLPVDVDGLRVGAPHSQTLLDDLLNLWEVGLQGLVAEHFSENLQREKVKDNSN